MSANPRLTLVLLHGAVLNHRMWDPVAWELRREFKVITPDLPGHGRHPVGAFELDAAAATVVDAVRSSGSSQVVLVGDSLGAYSALWAAPHLGTQLAGAVLGGCTANFQGPLRWLYAARGALTKNLSAETVMKAASRRIGLAPDHVEGLLAAGVRPAAFGEAVAELRRINIAAQLRQISAPVMLVNGTGDWANRLGEKAALRGNDHVVLQHMQGLGHGVSLLQPQAFTRLVRHFSKSLGVVAAREAA